MFICCMLRYNIMSDILLLSKTEIRILNAMMIREKFDADENPSGVTSYSLSQNEKPIPIATWNDHYKKLEHDKIIERKNQHKEQT